jgi:osmoprotectant transport system permease protein
MSTVRSIWDFFGTGANWTGENGIGVRLWIHLWVSAVAVVTAGVIAVPSGLWLGHRRRGQLVVTAIANLGRAIPSLAVLALVVAAGGGIGFLPTYVAMFALAVPPMFVSAVTGIAEVDGAIVLAGRGAGMSEWQILRQVEAPLAVPLLLSGVRIATSQVIATATLGAFVGYNTLGLFITQGRANHDDGQLYGGVVLVVGMAIAAEVGFRLLQRAVTPWLAARGGSTSTHRRRVAG